MGDPPKATTDADTLSFETALERLEEIVEQLEAGELPLEDALGVFEQGVALSRRCSDRLADAERRIEELAPGGQGVRPFEEDDT
jgi:exodeoxyribonuclease VII small subunit